MKSAFAIALTAAIAVAQDDEERRPAADFQAIPFWRRRYAYCKMQANPAYPTSNPYGFFRLSEYWGGPLQISGWMRQLPAPSSAHGFSINWSRFVGDDCKSTEGHFNPTGETHGPQDFTPSHVGNLWPIFDNGVGDAWYYTMASRPTLFWGTNNVSNRSMVVHEEPDDFGFGGTSMSEYNGSMGREIACCNIRPFRIRRWPRTRDSTDVDYDFAEEYSADYDDFDPGRNLRDISDEERRNLEEADAFTLDEYRELFGEEFNPDDSLDFDSAFGQN